MVLLGTQQLRAGLGIFLLQSVTYETPYWTPIRTSDSTAEAKLKEKKNWDTQSLEHRQMAVLEGLKEKFPTFWGKHWVIMGRW